MSDIPEQAIDVAANIAAEVSEQAEHVEESIRSLNRTKLGYGGLGLLIGGAIGAAAAFKIVSTKAEQKYAKVADDEIARMAEHYQSKMVALEATEAKGDLDDIVTKKGYKSDDPSEVATASPMAITPPPAVVEAAKESILEEQPVEAKVIKEPQEHAEVVEDRNIWAEHGDSEDSWDYARERKSRDPMIPYIIHEDELSDFEYDQHKITYFEGDDVLCNERDEIIPTDERDQLVGENNMTRFGHGSSSPDVVYVRNDRLELIYEIVRSENSYAEEVHGFTHTNHDRRNLERMRERARRSQEDE